MNVYRWVWSACWLVVGAVPVAVGLVVAPVTVVCVGLLAATATAAVGAGHDRWAAHAWLRAGLLGAAVAGGLSASGPAGFGLLVLAAATAPPVVRRAVACRRSALGRPGVGVVDLPSVLTADLLAGPVHALEDGALCRAWSDSFVALKLSRTSAERLELVNLRQAYLDELESRNAFGFHAWLRSGARPVANPARYLALHEPYGSPRPSLGDQRDG
ncbi:hypothetical protein [Nocardioides sp. URHA0020]|uniref:hypothetical protein n=1 Tax=Nocardioides sp. URHA0020 TaxID=1380392 RepID=UPI00048A73D9|nr:hypothetical protein [Nocardioides sp. URHA0020]